MYQVCKIIVSFSVIFQQISRLTSAAEMYVLKNYLIKNYAKINLSLEVGMLAKISSCQRQGSLLLNSLSPMDP